MNDDPSKPERSLPPRLRGAPEASHSSLLRVAVVGVGHMGRHHARICAALPQVSLAAVADPDEAAGRKVARKCRTQWVRSVAEIPPVDAVTVAAPTRRHHEICRTFLDRGVSVLVEKPICDDLSHADDLIRAAGASGACLQVGHVERFNPALAAILERDLQPKFIECHRLSPFRFRSADVGVVFDLMIHDIDIIRHLVGSDLRQIEAVGVNVMGEHEDIANARLTFENGCVANVTASRVSVKSMRKIRLFGSDSYVSIDYEKKKALIYKKSPELSVASLKARERGWRTLLDLKDLAFGDLLSIEDVKLDDYEPLKKEIESFVECVRQGGSPVVSGQDGMEAVRIAATILQRIAQSQKAASISPHGAPAQESRPE